MKIILIGNYPGDRQESMSRYSIALKDNLIRNEVEVEIVQPIYFFAPHYKLTTSGLLKWLGYVDKYVVFPVILKLKVLKEMKNKKKEVFFHICDHSNSMYLNFLPKNKSGITCHDVLAIQGAMGIEEVHCKATRSGKILQNWILKSLKKARILTAVSNNTMEHLTKLCEIKNGSKSTWRVIHNSFNSHFWPMEQRESRKLLNAINFPEVPFILHVGSGLPRKNRGLLLDMVKLLGDRWNGNIYFAGDPLDMNLRQRVREYGLVDRVKSVTRPDHQTLVALYSSCEAFVFPSFSEGFGWPLIEAQACGAPVIASSILTLQEIGGEAAIYANPHKPEDFTEGFLKLFHKKERKKNIALGFDNIKRFDSHKITREFIRLYKN